jgi:hypothetical protein
MAQNRHRTALRGRLFYFWSIWSFLSRGVLRAVLARQCICITDLWQPYGCLSTGGYKAFTSESRAIILSEFAEDQQDGLFCKSCDDGVGTLGA